MTDVAALLEKLKNRGVPRGVVLEADWTELPAETGGGTPSPMSLMSGGLEAFNKPLTLRQTVDALHHAAADPNVAALVVRVQPLMTAPSVVQELSDAIGVFRAAGKRTVAYAETFNGTGGYVLASAFETVVLQPAGSLALLGRVATVGFYRDALEWAGVKMDMGKRHEYKNAPNIFLETGFTEPHAEATTALLADLNDQAVTTIAAARAIEESVVRDAMLRGPLSSADALASGLIDVAGFRDEAYAKALGLHGSATSLLYLAKWVKKTANDKARKAALKNAQSIALITIDGGIAPGKSGFQPGLQPGNGTGSDTAGAALRAAAKDPKVKAVILRVDSPGGDVVASETIWREVGLVQRAGKPVVTSMASVAASGGYYVAMGTDRIVANAATITGSIGVFGGKPVIGRMREKLRIHTGQLATDDNADVGSLQHGYSPAQRARADEMLDTIYAEFTGRVADGRGMSVEDVHEVARGRVWTGQAASERGLVDELGGFRVAVAAAKRLAGIDEHAVVKIAVFPKARPIDKLFPKDSSAAAQAVIGWMAAGVVRAAREWEQRAGAASVRSRLDGDWRVW